MTPLGIIPLTSPASAYDARAKVRLVALALGADELTATRVGTAVSQIVRRLSESGGGGTIEVSVDQERVGATLGLELTSSGSVDRLAFLDAFFESSESTEHGVRLGCELGVVALDNHAIHRARAVMAERSRDQLMAEISEQNDALEKAKEQLEQTVRDRTSELELTLEELEIQRQAADTANEAKSSFLANMSHELRTPMNAIIGYSEMLTEDAEDEGLDEMVGDLNKINAAGKHLLSLINDVLDLSKIEAGRMELYLETFDLRQMLDDVASTAQPLFEKNNNGFVLDVDERVAEAHLDVTKVRQSLFNLLSNAAKFTHDGTITLAVRLVDKSGVAWVEMAVSDTGIGISEDKLSKVFEEFAQADESTTRDFGGTGLGLSLTRQICQMMGGGIELHSEVGVGSTFTIALPLEVMPDPAAAG
jgi:signal transduction histidine kinase